MQRYLLSFFYILMMAGPVAAQQQIERFANSLPVFFAFADIQAKDGVLTVGVYSESVKNLDKATLSVFENLKPWSNESVVSTTKHRKIQAEALTSSNIGQFGGQIIWVLDASDASLELLKAQTQKGIFTIGSQEQKYSNFLFTTLIYDNISEDAKVEKWRLSKLIANCELSKIVYSDKLKTKNYFEGKNCN